MRSLAAALALCALAISLVAIQGGWHPLRGAAQARSQNPLPLVDELDRLTKDNWTRVAGRDTGLPPHVNGHDEFAAAWVRQIEANLHGLPAAVFRQAFTTPGFRGFPAKLPGVNVVVVVPGSRHADRALIVGCHYDGEPFSKGSVFDDASGCVITLGLAHALGAVWRTHGLPSITVEFVLFDAEEQGLVGSIWYALSYLLGAVLPRPVLMIDEEQNGVGYPVRPFGLLSRRSLPSYADTSSRVPHFVSSLLNGPQAPSKSARTLLLQRLYAARDLVFPHLHSAYPTLAYRSGSAPAFTSGARRFLRIGEFSICCSDNDPFAALRIPTVTLAGDSAFYSRDAKSWSFPFDQPQDTLANLACDTGGSPVPNLALEAALSLPLELSQQLVMDYAPTASGSDIALFSTLPVAAQPAQFVAAGARHAIWRFGDGGTAAGAQVQHTYLRAGRYQVTVQSDVGTASRSVQVWPAPLPTAVPFVLHPPHLKRWHPRELERVAGCH